MNDKDYFQYLKGRSLVSLAFRKYFYKSILRELRGKILDVGCGLGEFMNDCRNFSGVDANPYCVSYCKGKGFNAKVGKAEKLSFKDGSFDGVFCLCVLEHLRKPELAVREIRRVLKKNGKAVIIVPTEAGFRHDKTHVTFIDKHMMRSLLEKNGFKIDKMFFFPFAFKFLREKLYFNELRVVASKR
jgi:ubiquinone/menaquinone biosynthesis C-methylase UbiE